MTVELLYSVVVAVGDVQGSLRADRHGSGVVELSGADADLAGRAFLPDKAAIGLQLLNALVVDVGDPQFAIGRDGHAAGRIELAGATARAADDAPGQAVQAEHLDTVVEVFGHIEFVGVHRQVHRPAELPDTTAGRAELAFEVAVEIEDLDTPVARVGNEHLITGNGDAGRVVELPGCAARLTPGADELIGRLLARGHEGQPAGQADERQDDDGIAAQLEHSSALHGSSP